MTSYSFVSCIALVCGKGKYIAEFGWEGKEQFRDEMEARGRRRRRREV